MGVTTLRLSFNSPLIITLVPISLDLKIGGVIVWLSFTDFHYLYS